MDDFRYNSYLFIISSPSFLFLQITETENGQIVTLNEEAAQGTLEQICLVKQRAWNILNETEDILKKAGVYIQSIKQYNTPLLNSFIYSPSI